LRPDVHAGTTWADADPDARPRDDNADAWTWSATGPSAVQQAILLADGWRALDIAPSALAGPAAHRGRCDEARGGIDPQRLRNERKRFACAEADRQREQRS